MASGGRDAERVKLKLEIVVEVIYRLSNCICPVFLSISIQHVN